MKRALSTLMVLMATTFHVHCQVNMTTSGSHTQNFNGLATSGTSNSWADNSTIANWYSQRTGTGTTYAADAGTSNAGGLYSYGATSSSDRALGTLGSGNAAVGSFAHGVLLRNTSGTTITDIKVTYTLEQWRNGGNTTAQAITFYYRTSSTIITSLTPNNNSGWTQVTGLTLNSPINTSSASALDGNASANRVTATNVSIPSLSLANNDYIMLKWEDPDHSGTDHGLAIDDVTITWTVNVTPSLTTTLTTLSGFSYTIGSGPSAEQSFTVSGTNLSADITITPPTNYEISTGTGLSFTPTNPITLSPTNGTVDQTVIYVRLKSGLSAGAYNGEVINITSTGADAKTVTCSGDVWPQIEWANLQWPTTGTITQGDNFTVYAQVYKGGVTDAAGQGAGIQAWIGYSTSNTNPNTWTNWVSATYNADVGNNDEYMANIGTAITSTGVYYYASRFKLGNADYVYGGTGGFWNGTGNNSGQLTVNAAPTLEWVNLQWPGSGTITTGGEFFVYAQAYQPGVTPGPGAGSGISAWIGYSTDDTDPSTWTNWHAASYFGESGNNDEYRLDLGAVISSPGTYYYASRFKLGSADYQYGGFSAGGGGFWNGTSYVSGILTVQTPEPSNHATGFTASQTQPTTTTITLNWTDASPAAEAYLIKGSATAYGSITAPVDGTAESDGTLVKNVLAGVQTHTFTGLTPGTTYYFKIWPYNGSGSNINYKTDGSVPEASAATLGLPSLTEVILPQYIQGVSGTNNNRVPFAYRATINNLNPNSTYRYYNQVVIASDAATDNGAGNIIFVKTSGDFVRTTSASLSTSGGYGEFTTDGTGAFTGWFVTEPTGNARFAVGNSIYPRIMLNDGNNGTSVSLRLTTTNPITVINFGTSSTATNGTGIYGNSYASDRSFAVLYDNTSGTGRPITATLVESDGTTGGTTYIGFYQSNVEGQSGRWGAIIPNVNANGIKRIEYRKLIDGNLIYHTADDDGVWGGVNTVNPTGGSTALVMPHNDVQNMTIASGGSVSIPSNSTLTVTGTLTNNGTLTLKSDATGTASLLHNTNNVPATLERYITGNTNLSSMQYHLVSVPLNAGVTSAQFLGSYLYQFNTSTQQWQSLGGSTSTPLANTQGYMIFYPNTSTTYTFNGQLNNGNITYNPPLTAANQFVLLPNPYPSAIYIGDEDFMPSNLQHAIWIWNPAGPNYASYSDGVDVNGGTPYIPVGQAFFMKSTGSSPSLSISNYVRVHNSQPFWKSGNNIANVLRMHSAANGRQDEIALRLRPQSSAGYDNFDVDKLSGANFVPQLSFLVEGKEVAINNIPPDALPISIPVSFKMQATGLVNLSFEGIDSFDSNIQFLLEDLLTGTTVNLRQTPSYSFSHSPGNNPQRLVLHLTSVTAQPELPTAIGMRAWFDGRDICLSLPDAGGTLELELFDATGRLLAQYRRDAAPLIRIPAMRQGVVMLRARINNQAYATKVFTF